jgi:hypothetical protein
MVLKLGCKGRRQARESPNLKSVNNDPSAVHAKLTKEIKLGRLAGPFNKSPLPNLMISPIFHIGLFFSLKNRGRKILVNSVFILP